MSAYHDAWRRQLGDAGAGAAVRFNKGDDRDRVDTLAQRMLAAFIASPLASPRGTILGVEEELRVVLAPDLPDVLARVDLVTMTDGSLFVVDFKTSRSRWTEQKAQESGDQLLLYGRTVERMGTSLGLPVKLHFAVLTKAKTPVVQLLVVPTRDYARGIIELAVHRGAAVGLDLAAVRPPYKSERVGEVPSRADLERLVKTGERTRTGWLTQVWDSVMGAFGDFGIKTVQKDWNAFRPRGTPKPGSKYANVEPPFDRDLPHRVVVRRVWSWDGLPTDPTPCWRAIRPTAEVGPPSSASARSTSGSPYASFCVG